MNAQCSPDPSPSELAEIEARKAAIHARHVAAEWPRSATPGVYWDGEMWEAKVRREGQPGRHKRLIRVPSEDDAARAIGAWLGEFPDGRPGSPTLPPPNGLPPEPPRESIAFPSIKAAEPISPPPNAIAPSPTRLRAAGDLATVPGCPQAVFTPAAVPARVEAVATVGPTESAAIFALDSKIHPPELAALRAVLDAVERLPKSAAKWTVFAALAHLEQVK